MTEIKNSILAGVVFGVLFGLFNSFLFGTHNILIIAPIAGVLFGAGIYFFLTSKTVKKQTQVQTAEGENIIHSGAANHFKNGEAVGGKLYLLPGKLQFQSHNFNVQNHGLIIDLQEIKGVTFYNTLGLIPNGLAIATTNGQTEKFVVTGRRLWKDEIENHKIAHSSI
ncbi:MAG: GRAM domain-containing protein [Bacteroidia bacterium]